MSYRLLSGVRARQIKPSRCKDSGSPSKQISEPDRLFVEYAGDKEVAGAEP